jgi:hypothetical protein
MDIQKLVKTIPFLKENVRSFNLLAFSNAAGKQAFTLSFEIKECISPLELDLLHCEFSQQILECLRSIENGIWEYGIEPSIRFFIGIQETE